MSFLKKEFKKPTYVSSIEFNEKAQTPTKASKFHLHRFKVWQSRTSWRIAYICFLTVLLIQAGILGLLLHSYEGHQLDKLEDIAVSSLAPIMKQNYQAGFDDRAPISNQEANNLIASTKITGLAFYKPDLTLIKVYGDMPFIQPQSLRSDDFIETYRSENGLVYDVVLQPDALRYPYIIVAQMDSSDVQAEVFGYVKEAILAMIVISMIVTIIIILSVGNFLLGPVIFMRDNLIKAAQNPENPDIEDSHFSTKNEIGESIDIAMRLVKQNAENIQRIKSTAEDQIHKLAYYDTLTNLPNRAFFLQSMGEMAHGKDGKTPGRFCVLTVDLDHFKDINDTMGYNIGDAILRAVGKRLRSSLPESAVVARIAEDEFAAAVPLTSDKDSARDVATRVLNVVKSSPFKVFTEDFQVRASVGVATYPDDGTDIEQILKNSDIALNRSKEEGRDRVKEYSEDFDRAVQQRFQILRNLRDALEHDQLLLHYQPQLDLKTGRVIGAEALIRWWKPDNSKEGGHYVPPIEFIPIAEQSGLIVPIGEWVLKTACEMASKFQSDGHDIRIAVNVSGAQFYQSNLVGFVETTLRETDLKPDHLELEVTESVFMDDISHAITTLRNLHGLGIEIAIDDFGTGYSSLSYLRQFPIDRLKIDQSFIRNALNNPDDAAIAQTIVRLGHSLNLKVIAEGVETVPQQKFLEEEGCDEVQGYLYAKPMTEQEFRKFLEGYSGNIDDFAQD